MAHEFVLDHLDRSGPQNAWVSLAEMFQMFRFSAFTQLSEARRRAPPIGAQWPEQQGEAMQVGPVPAFAFCTTKKNQNSTLCFSPNRFLAKVSSNQSNEPGEQELSGQDGGSAAGGSRLHWAKMPRGLLGARGCPEPHLQLWLRSKIPPDLSPADPSQHG